MAQVLQSGGRQKQHSKQRSFSLYHNVLVHPIQSFAMTSSNISNPKSSSFTHHSSLLAARRILRYLPDWSTAMTIGLTHFG